MQVLTANILGIITRYCRWLLILVVVLFPSPQLSRFSDPQATIASSISYTPIPYDQYHQWYVLLLEC